jgi:hypothetical protein
MIARKVLAFYEEIKKTYKGIDYEIVKDAGKYHAEIEREEIEGTETKTPERTDKKTKEYIDSVI